MIPSPGTHIFETENRLLAISNYLGLSFASLFVAGGHLKAADLSGATVLPIPTQSFHFFE
jgi:hypothetical protein